MSGTIPVAPADLTAATIIGRLEAAEYPPEVVANLAAGFLPLPQEDLIAVLAYLALSGEDDVRLVARTSLNEIPPRSIGAFASNDRLPPEHLDLLLRASDDEQVLEALIRNRAVGDTAVEEVARRAEAHIQEVIVINQARILRSPAILDALEANPALTPDVRRRILETREEFFEKKARQAAIDLAAVDEDEAIADLPVEAIQDLLERAAVEEAGGATLPPPELLEIEKKDPTKVSIFSRILTMSVSEKVQLGFKGGKTERTILVRDRNKLVCSAVVRNPRMNEQEVETIAGMRNIDEEVLRLIAMKREWMSKYNILIALARNPKVPIGIVLTLINRLTLRDLKGLKDDKGVSEAVRSAARKTFAQRTQKS
jgi:hypothetical protein